MSNRLKEIILISDSSGEKSIVSYDPCTGNQLNVYKHAGTVAPHTLQVLRDSYLLAADLTKPRLHLWPLNSQNPVSNVRFPTPGKVSALACSQNGKYAVAAINEKLFLWQTSTGRLLSTLTGHFQIVTSIKFNADGSCFASAGEDNLIFVWSLGGCTNSSHLSEDSSQPLHTFSYHSRPVKDICFGSLTKRSILCSVSLDKSLKIYDTSQGQLLLSLIFTEPLTAVCVDANENYVFVGTISGDIKQFSMRDPPRTIDFIAASKELSSMKAHEAPISSLSVSSDCMRLLSGDDTGKIRIWNIASGIVTKEISHKGRISNAVFAPAFENYRATTFKPSLALKTLQWSSGEDEEGILEVICQDESERLLNYDDYVKSDEVCGETRDRSLVAQNEELRKINNALMKKIMKSILSDK